MSPTQWPRAEGSQVLRRLADDLRYGAGALAEDLAGVAPAIVALATAGGLVLGSTGWPGAWRLRWPPRSG